MTGYLERLCEHISFLRLGPDCRQFGDPWEWGVPVFHEGASRALIFGLHGTVKPEHFKGVQDVLHAAGIGTMRFQRRRRNGEMVWRNHATCRRRKQGAR